jgi:SAM-dependent methyltransferase
MTLTPAEARAFYDRFGSKQDSQGFYENPALDDLVTHARFAEATRVFEFGCGTGRFAARLLAEALPASATYVGCDLSATMVGLARQRLSGHPVRAQVLQADGSARIPLPDHSVDRVVSTYVLDLLPDAAIGEVLREAHRVLATGGRLCLVSLTFGTTLLSRLVTAAWNAVFGWRASLVGGCRPISLAQALDASGWELEHRDVVSAFGVASEVVVAIARAIPGEVAPTAGAAAPGR